MATAADTAAAEGRKGRTAQSMNEIRDAINKQPKMKFQVQRPPHVPKGMHHKEIVTINEYSFSIPTGVWVTAPEEVYLILVRSGKVGPLREEDQYEVPDIIAQQGEAYGAMLSGVAGSMNNPIQVS